MKIGNLKGLTPLLAATLLVSAWIIHALAAEPKKTTDAEPKKTPKAEKSAMKFTPTNATAAQLKAKLKAKVDPKLVVVHKRTPIKFVAFTLANFKDKSGKVPTANEAVTLPNGTKSTWGKYLTAINKVEKEANPSATACAARGKRSRFRN